MESPLTKDVRKLLLSIYRFIVLYRILPRSVQRKLRGLAFLAQISYSWGRSVVPRISELSTLPEAVFPGGVVAPLKRIADILQVEVAASVQSTRSGDAPGVRGIRGDRLDITPAHHRSVSFSKAPIFAIYISGRMELLV